MNNKASLVDSILVPAYILGVAMTIIIVMFVWNAFSTNFTPIATQVNMSDGRNLTSVMGEITVSIGTLDYMFPMMVAGLLLVSLIFAYRTGANIIYAFVSVFMWILALVLSAVYTNIFEQFASNFASIGGSYTIISYVMLNIKWIVLIWAVLISVVMFTRTSKDNSSQQLFAAQDRGYM